MNHKTKTFLLSLLLLGLVVFIGLIATSEGGITGAVIGKVACYQDAECSDSIEQTQDICRNPGTEYSLCVNIPIEKP